MLIYYRSVPFGEHRTTWSAHEIHFSPSQENAVNQLLAFFEKAPFEPPSVEECVDRVGQEVYQSLLDQQKLIQISPEIVFLGFVYRRAEEAIRSLLAAKGTITLAEVRDRFNTSRKFAMAILEHMDRIGITIRDGNSRKLKNSG